MTVEVEKESVPVFVPPRALPIIHKSTSEIALFKEEGKENAPAEQGTMVLQAAWLIECPCFVDRALSILEDRAWVDMGKCRGENMIEEVKVNRKDERTTSMRMTGDGVKYHIPKAPMKIKGLVGTEYPEAARNAVVRAVVLEELQIETFVEMRVWS
ncbi:hypothetical protein BGY98DRAFT_1179908 [Russula aff. rugulosa BPL654]|nr:hypothetical protein BGY98DRAFT_1179908 [Russula aff. rugulosa BPL654]